MLNVWADESCTLYATHGSLAFVCDKAVNFEWQPPAYHLILSVWRKLHGGIFFARCFSIACTSVTILTIYRTARLLGVKQPLLPAALFAFHPFGIYLATEIRLYGFATMVSALLFCTLIKAYWLKPEDENGPSWPNTLCSVLGLYTNILLGIPLAAQTAGIALFRRGLFPRYVLRMLLVVVAFAPMVGYQLSLAKSTELFPQNNTPVNLATYLLGSLQFFVFPLPRTDATLVLRGVLLVMLLGIVAIVIYRYRPRLAWRHAFVGVYLAVSCVTLAVFIYVADVSRTERYTYVLVPATMVWWAMLLELADGGRLKHVVYAISFLFCFVSVLIIYQPLCKSGDWIRVARHLETTAEAGEPIVVFPAEVQTLLQFYYSGGNPIVPVPTPQRFDRFRMSDFRIPDRATLSQVLRPRLLQAASLMLVTFDPAIYRPEIDDPLNFGLLESYLREDFEEVSRTNFFDTTVRRYERKSQP